MARRNQKDNEDLTKPSSDDITSGNKPRISFNDLEKSMTLFTGDDTYPIETWISDFEDTATLMEWTEIEKIIYSKRLLSGTAKLFLRSLGSITSWVVLKELLKEEFAPKLSSATIHKKLASRKMKTSETYQQYFLHMKELAMHGKVEDEAIIEYVIDGIRDSETNKSILYGATDMKQFRKKLEVYTQIKEKMHHKAAAQITPTTTTGRKPVYTKRCYNCGDSSHQSSACTNGIKCFKCNEYGHKSNECQSTMKKTLKIQDVSDFTSNLRQPYKKAKINDIEVTTFLDTGSDANLIRECYYREVLSKDNDYDPNNTLNLSGIAEHEVRTKGSFTARIEMDDVTFETKINVVDDDVIPVNILLGNPILNEIEIAFSADGISVKKILHLTQINDYKEELTDKYDIKTMKYKDTIKKLLEDYDDLKTTTKESNVKLKIILTNEDPIHQTPRRLSPLELNIVNKQIEEWLDQDVIKASKSEFASPIVLAKKKNGSYRLCVDYRRLNKKIIRERFPLPLIEDLLDKLKEAQLFTSLDLKNGFLHVNVSEESQKYTAFVTPQGQYEFNKMPFGLCTAPSVFQRFVNDIFQDFILDGTVLAYLDDLIIPSKTEEEGIKKMKKILERAQEYGLQFNWEKCHFLQREIQYLGYIICDNHVKPSTEKIQAVARFKKPENIKGLRSFLGLTGYFRKFVKDYSIIAKPLTDLLKMDVNFDFDINCERAFEKLKQILCGSPVLRIYDSNLETELHTDASIDGYGAVLLQRSQKDNQLHPIYYMSKKTTPAEKKYHSYYLEILAIVEAIKKFRVYLLGIRFKIITDCSALTMTLQKKDLPHRVARWALLLEEFDYKIEHRSGTQMRHVDTLSRYPVSLILTETTARLKRAQDDDLKIKLLKKLLEREPYEDFVLENGILCKVKDGTRLIVVPKKMINEIIRKCHEKGHFGIIKTEELLNRDYYIENSKEKIRSIIDNCVECILISHKKGRKEGYLHPLDKGDTPLSTYHVDHLGPLTSTNKNYKYIFTVVDGFTKFTWIYPTKTLSTEEVLQKLRLQQETFGSPERIITDRNAAFTSNDFKTYCNEENITHYVITTGQPRGNGQVERIHQIIINVLSKLTSDDPAKWYRQIGKVQRCLNGTYQRSIGMTPFELLTGIKMRDKSDDILKLIEKENLVYFQDKRSELRDRAKQNIQKIQEENRKVYNRKRREAIQYEIGDLVAIKRTQFVQGYKLHPKYLGPYQIIQKKRNDRYTVKKIGDGEGPINTTSSADMMKPWSNGDDEQESHSSGPDE